MEKYCVSSTNKENAGRPLCRMVHCGECGSSCNYKIFRGNGYPREVIICNKYLTRGKSACATRAIPYQIILSITAEVLRMEDTELTRQNVSQTLENIVLDKDKLTYYFKDGRVIVKPWQLISRSKSWTPEMRERARQRALARYAKK